MGGTLASRFGWWSSRWYCPVLAMFVVGVGCGGWGGAGRVGHAVGFLENGLFF
jgi:hypothetical protein